MPFGLIFGALAFSVLFLCFGVLSLGAPGVVPKIGGVALIVLGLSLSLGLLRRQKLARWTGIGASAFMVLAGGTNTLQTGALIPLVVFFAGLATFVLLILPPTGDVRRGLDGSAAELRGRGRVLGWTAVVSFAVLVGVSGWARLAQDTSAAAMPRMAMQRVEWLDFRSGLEKARSEGKPALVDFYADWCGPCKEMDRRTFRNPEVTQRLSDFVTIRVDSEETEPRNGHVGSELADRYGVVGYPTLMVLNGDGKMISRRSGYQSAGELLSWLAQVQAAGPEPESDPPADISL